MQPKRGNLMKVKIERHRGKIAILTEQASDTIRLGTLLRSVINGSNLIVSIKNGYLVPLESINVLAKHLPPESHCWDRELQHTALMSLNVMESQSLAKLEVAQALDHPYHALNDYEEIWRLDPHQVEAVAAMTVPSLQGMALFDEQGVGKTICGLAAFDLLRQKGLVSHLLVVAPKSVLPVWKQEIANFLKDRYSVKTVVGRQAKPLDLLQGEVDVLLVSYEAVTRALVILQGLVSTKKREYMLVVDESYYVKNPVAQRSRAVAKLRQWCKRAYVLCGAPAPNSPTDVIHQIDIADAGTTFGGLSIPADEDSAAVVVEKALGNSAIYLRRLKEEALPELPAKSIRKTFVELQPVQDSLYRDAMTNLIIDVRQVDDTYFRKHLGVFMARKWALLQICSNPAGIAPVYSEIPAKLLALDQIVKNIVEERGLKIIIWSFFRYSLQTIVSRYTRYGVVRIDGSVDSIQERELAVRRFQSDPSINIFVGNPAAAGAGITLTAASHAVFESFSNQPAHYLQSVDRIHRRGQQNPVTSFVLISQSTVEEREFDKLIQKERRGHKIFGKQPREPITREGFLRDLTGD